MTSPGGRVAILDEPRHARARRPGACGLHRCARGRRARGRSHPRRARGPRRRRGGGAPRGGRRSRRRASGGDAVGIRNCASMRRPACSSPSSAGAVDRHSARAGTGTAGTVRRLGGVAPGAENGPIMPRRPGRRPTTSAPGGTEADADQLSLAAWGLEPHSGARSGASPTGPSRRLIWRLDGSAPAADVALRARRAYDRLGELGVTLAADETPRGIEVTMPLARVGVVLRTLGEWAILPDVVCIDAAPADARPAPRDHRLARPGHARDRYARGARPDGTAEGPRSPLVRAVYPHPSPWRSPWLALLA